MRSRGETYFLIALFCLAILMTGPVRASAQPVIGILLSSKAAPYLQAVAGFKETMLKQQGDAVFEFIEPSALKDREKAAVQRCSLLLAIGSQATQAAAELQLAVPVVGAMVLRPEALTLSPSMTGVYIEPSLDDQLTWIARLLPKARVAGVVYAPQENGELVHKAVPAFQAKGLKLEQREIVDPKELDSTLDKLKNSVDLIWGITDSVTFTPETAKQILGFSFRHKIPLIAPSSAWVKAGAMFGWDWDYQDIGRQAADLGVSLLNGKPANQLPPTPARRLLYGINLRTAAAMGIDLPREIIDGASVREGT